jgi:endoglucanase
MIENQIESEEFFSLLEKLMRTPTAPFREHHIRALVLSEAGLRPQVSIKEDVWGNLLVSYFGNASGGDCVFCAHMDHPGFVDGKFLGSMRPEYLAKGNSVVDCVDGIGVWNLPAYEKCDTWIRGRACDDLVGCSVALATVFHHARAASPCNVHALLTVAEEVGLLGAALACDAGTIPRGATVISVETSPVLNVQQFHSGCIVRVGDRRSIFSPSVTRDLVDVATRRNIIHRRHLMDGGSCEGTVFCDAGFNTGALCVALGNAHNQGAHETTEMEYVSTSDTLQMLRLTIAAAECLSASEKPRPSLMESRIEGAKREFFSHSPTAKQKNMFA